MRQLYASTAKQSLLDLINGDNKTSLTLDDYTINFAANTSDAPKNKALTMNTKVTVAEKRRPSNDVDVWYQRLSAPQLFGSSPQVVVESQNPTDAERLTAATEFITKTHGIPLDETSSYTVSQSGTNVTFTFNTHWILTGTTTIKVVPGKALSTVIKVTQTEDVPSADDTSMTSKQVLLALINDLNRTKLTLNDIDFINPTTISDNPPTDQVTIIPAAGSTYAGELVFKYTRFPLDVLEPDGFSTGKYTSLSGFKSKNTASQIAKDLTFNYGYQILERELELGEYTEQTQGYPPFYVDVKIVGNFAIKTVDKLRVYGILP